MTRFPMARVLVSALAAAGAVAALSCGGGSPSSPPPPTTPTTTQPTTAVDPSLFTCKLGQGSDTFDCLKQDARLYGHVVAAIDQLIKQKPQLFDLEDEIIPGSGDYRVVDRDGYLDGVVINLQKMGLCAERDASDYNYERISVKADNLASEEYDIITGAGYTRQNAGIYLTTCVPATFPVPRVEGEVPPPGSGCGRPYPLVTRFHIWVRLSGNDTDVLDTTPMVGPDQAYCAAVGFTDGRGFCAVRPFGSPERIPCENWAVGNAEDNGRPGPTWRNEKGEFCTGKDSGCENHPENQYALNVYRPGTYSSCGRNGACGRIEVK